MPKSAELLGALDKSNPNDEAYLFEDEYHVDVIQDFCIHDTTINGINLLESAVENLQFNEREREIIDVYKKNTLELYQVTSIETNKFRVNTKNLRTGEVSYFIDIAMSSCIDFQGHLIFARLLDFGRQKITSGMTMPFYVENSREVVELLYGDHEAEEGLTERQDDFIRMNSLYWDIGIKMNPPS